jgi:hypothetical protein
VRLPGSSPAFIGLPHHSIGSASRFHPRTRFSAGRLSRLQLFRYVQASEFARLPDRSYRCKFPCRAAEAFTSEQNVRRYLRTHRTCYPPDYRQLAERELSSRKIRSLVGCYRMMPTFPRCPLKFRRGCYDHRRGGRRRSRQSGPARASPLMGSRNPHRLSGTSLCRWRPLGRLF